MSGHMPRIDATGDFYEKRNDAEGAPDAYMSCDRDDSDVTSGWCFPYKSSGK